MSDADVSVPSEHERGKRKCPPLQATLESADVGNAKALEPSSSSFAFSLLQQHAVTFDRELKLKQQRSRRRKVREKRVREESMLSMREAEGRLEALTEFTADALLFHHPNFQTIAIIAHQLLLDQLGILLQSLQ